MTDDEMAAVLKQLDTWPAGYGEGLYDGRRYGVTRRASPDGRRIWLFGEDLAFVRFILNPSASKRS